MALILLSGLPGSGKTTFATALAAHAPVVHIESDAIRRNLVPKPLYTAAEHARVFAEVERFAAQALDAGSHVVLDATNLQERFRGAYVAMATARHIPIVCVTLTAPLHVLRSRVQHPRTGHSQAGRPVLDGMLHNVDRFRQPSLIVDTRFDIAPSVSAALALAGVAQTPPRPASAPPLPRESGDTMAEGHDRQ